MLTDQPRDPATDEAHHRSNREINPSGDDHEGNANREKPIKRCSLQQLPLVVAAQEIVPDGRRQDVEHDQGDKNTENLFHLTIGLRVA